MRGRKDTFTLPVSALRGRAPPLPPRFRHLWKMATTYRNRFADRRDVCFYGQVFGVGGSNGAISGLIISKMAADNHLGMTVLSRVTLAAAGLSSLLLAVAISFKISWDQNFTEKWKDTQRTEAPYASSSRRRGRRGGRKGRGYSPPQPRTGSNYYYFNKLPNKQTNKFGLKILIRLLVATVVSRLRQTHPLMVKQLIQIYKGVSFILNKNRTYETYCNSW